MRGAILAVCLIITTGVVAFLTRPAGRPEGWIKIKDVAHLKQEVERAIKEKRPVVVKIVGDLVHVLQGVRRRDRRGRLPARRLRGHGPPQDRRREGRARRSPGGRGPARRSAEDGVLRREGRIRRAADIQQWHGDESDDELKKRVDFLFWRRERPSGTTPRARLPTGTARQVPGRGAAWPAEVATWRPGSTSTGGSRGPRRPSCPRSIAGSSTATPSTRSCGGTAACSSSSRSTWPAARQRRAPLHGHHAVRRGAARGAVDATIEATGATRRRGRLRATHGDARHAAPLGLAVEARGTSLRRRRRRAGEPPLARAVGAGPHDDRREPPRNPRVALDPRAKTGNYLNNVLALHEARLAGRRRRDHAERGGRGDGGHDRQRLRRARRGGCARRRSTPASSGHDAHAHPRALRRARSRRRRSASCDSADLGARRRGVRVLVGPKGILPVLADRRAARSATGAPGPVTRRIRDLVRGGGRRGGARVAARHLRGLSAWTSRGRSQLPDPCRRRRHSVAPRAA